MKYRKKPVIIDAFEYEGYIIFKKSRLNYDESFTGMRFYLYRTHFV